MKGEIKRWSRNWSGRGTAMLAREDRASKPVETNYLHPRKKLRFLLDRYPNNEFFLSLNAWKGVFTERQQQAIERGFKREQQSRARYR